MKNARSYSSGENSDEESLSPTKSQSTRDTRITYHFGVKDLEEQRPKIKDLVNKFSFIHLPEKDSLGLLFLPERELVNYLNTLMYTFNPDSPDPSTNYFSYKENTVITNVGTSARKFGVGARYIFRNSTGKFAWEMTYIPALNENIINSEKKHIEKLLQRTVKLKSGDFGRTKEKKEEIKDDLELKRVHFDDEKENEIDLRRDLVQKIFEWAREISPEAKELLMSKDTKEDKEYDKARDFDTERKQSA
jgi:hypothetical protein